MSASLPHGSAAPTASISLILPCWRDADLAVELAQQWSDHDAIKEVILAGVAGFRPLTPLPARVRWCETSSASRGAQLSEGGNLASGDILLFHHVDSLLTAAHLQSILSAMRDQTFIGGAFYRHFDSRHPGLRWLQRFERTHSKLFGTIYGDQSVFVRREHFHRIGGFPQIPLMEDVEFSRRLRRSGKIVMLDPPMESSPHAQIEQGSWRVTLRNLSFLILFRWGADANKLHRRYYKSMNAANESTHARNPRRNPCEIRRAVAGHR